MAVAAVVVAGSLFSFFSMKSNSKAENAIAVKALCGQRYPLPQQSKFFDMDGEAGAAALKGLVTYAFTYGEFSSPSIHPSPPGPNVEALRPDSQALELDFQAPGPDSQALGLGA